MGARIAFARSIALLGLEGYSVDVEAHVGRGLVTFTPVSLPDASFREARGRVHSALQTIECEVLDVRIMMNLSPAGLPESGSGFGLAVAVAILKAAETIRPQAFADTILPAELGLDRGLRPIKGTLPAAAAMKQIDAKCITVAAASTAEASLIADIEILSFDHLADVVAWTGG